MRLDVRVPSARQALKRDFSATDDALRERAHADRDRADHTPRASGDDPALHTRRASLTFPVHSYRVRSHRVQQIVCINTAACLFAGRFGLAPTVNKNYGGADSYGKMVEAERPRVVRHDDCRAAEATRATAAAISTALRVQFLCVRRAQ